MQPEQVIPMLQQSLSADPNVRNPAEAAMKVLGGHASAFTCFVTRKQSRV